jgi:GNAT superfamily N-acetyltransferase
MSADLAIRRAIASDGPEITRLVGELLQEIMAAIGSRAFNFDVDETALRLLDFIQREKYFVFVARDVAAEALGFVTIYESHALYAEGSFGTIAELYVRPFCRSRQIGARLLDEAKAFGRARGWKRLEVTTPPLPHFDRTLSFYEREGFAVTGGPKLKIGL